MDFLNKAFAQLSDLFRSMTPGARILAGLLLAVIVVSLGYLFNHQVTGGDVHLMGGRSFSANELPAMEAAFDKAGLKAYTIDGNQIRVPRGQQSAYMGALAENGAMPADFHTFLDKAVDNSPFEDKHQRDEKLKNAKQKELALIIRSMSGIENAAVHYDSKKKGGLKLSETLTASVTVKPRGSLTLERNRIQMIRHLVAASYAGLSPESVTVVDMNGRTYPAGSAEDSIGVGEHRHLAAMEQYQERYKHEILEALTYVPGATVHVNVEIDKVMKFQEEKVQVDPKPVMVSTSEETKTETTNNAPAGGRPGLSAQAPGANQAMTLQSSGGGSKSETEFNSSRGQSVVSHGKTQTEEIGLTPKRITVAIGVPVSYYAKIWRDQNPAVDGQPKKSPTAEELKQIEKDHITKIKEHVGQLLPKPVGIVDPVPLVSVTSFHDTLVEAALPTVSTAEQALGFLGNYGSTLGMVALALFSLLMLRSMLRAAPIESSAAAGSSSEIVSAAAAQAQSDEQATDEAAAPRVKRPKKTFGKGPSLKDELVDLVRDDPDAAANILRGWIGNSN